MSGEIELVNDGDGLSILGSQTDVERFMMSSGLDRALSRDLSLQKLWSVATTAGAVGQVGADAAASSGRWVKLTAESAAAVKEYGFMPSKVPGVSHAMVGKPGDIKQWIQVVQPTSLLSTPFALTALTSVMQQRAMQQQMDEIVEYLQQLDAKVDDILRGQKDAVLADMIGVDLIIEEAMIVRDEVGRVSEVTWSKVQSTGTTIARTQGYALRQLDAIAEKLQSQRDVGDVAKATRKAEAQVREWLAVLARTFQLQDGLAILELDRVLSTSPEELESHRAGLTVARRNRRELLSRNTARLLAQMEGTIRRANSMVLLNPFDAPAAVKSSNNIAVGVLDFRERIGLETVRDSEEVRRWRQAVADIRDKVVRSAGEGAATAGRLSAEAADRATGVFRAVDIDGDGVPDQARAAAIAEEAGRAVKGVALGARDVVGSVFKRKPR